MEERLGIQGPPEEEVKLVFDKLDERKKEAQEKFNKTIELYKKVMEE